MSGPKRREDPFEICGNMVRLVLLDKLKRPHTCLIDLADFALVRSYHWRAKLRDKRYYAWSSVWQEGKISTIQMHRLLMGLVVNEPKLVDHKDGDGLNNRRENLRIASSKVNGFNRCSPHPLNTTGYRGVTYHKNTKKYKVEIRHMRYGTYPSAHAANTVASTIYFLENFRDCQSLAKEQN